MTVAFSLGSRQRHLGHDPGAGLGSAANGAAPTEPGDTLLHAGQANPLARTSPRQDSGRSEAMPPVPYFEAHHAPTTAERDVRTGRLGMLPHVRERLLRHPEERRLVYRWQSLRTE